MRLGAAIALALLLAGCGSGEPGVDWSQIPSYQHVVIQDAVAAGKCDKMQAAFDVSERSDVLDYLDWHMRDVGCY
jgi:uncharacterized lipoprotein YmbA